MKKIISTVLIVLGILIALYPIGSNLYFDYWNNKLLAEVETEVSLERTVPQMVESDYLALEALFQEGEDEENSEFIEITDEMLLAGYVAQQPDEENASENDSGTDSPAPSPSPSNKTPILGQLSIPKINVKMAILEGATERNLGKGAARIEGTSQINEIGNVGIAGHRGRSYGRLLNRLDELDIDDTIEITSGGVKYRYRVYKKHIVEPSDVSVLYRSTTHKVLTLVTCDPVINPTHRLIVHAVQIEP